MEMTREQFMDLMGLKDGDDGMDYADECVARGIDSYWQLAKDSIATMNMLLLEN